MPSSTALLQKQEYVSIDMATGKRVTRCFWTIDNATAGGWKQTPAKKQYPTREAAGKALLKDADEPYKKKQMSWSKRSGKPTELTRA